MTKERNIDDYKRVLAVEGYSDLYFYAEILEDLGTHHEVFIQQFNGATDLIAKLETFLSPGLLAEKTAIAIIVDADADAEARKQSISTVIAKAANRTLEHGVWSAGQPNLGYFVVPDGTQSGEIETLVWQSWANDPANHSARDCIADFLSCMSAAGHNPQSIDKGRISALLAIQNDEDPRLGPGARGKKFVLDSPEYQPLRAFLSQL
jgi:Protein of unknown function (DUF3226)